MKQSTKFTIIAIISVVVFAIAVTPVTFQNDTFYTIKIGEHIMQTGQVDMKDPFSWHEDLPYTYPHWLYDVATYIIYSFTGFEGLYVATVLLTVALGVTLYLTSRKLTKNNFISLVITIMSMYLLRSFITARAQLVTYILFILTIYFIEMFLQTRKIRYAVFLIIIPILIANMHLAVFLFYFVLYLPYIGEYIISILPNIVLLVANLKIRFYQAKIRKCDSEEKIETFNKRIVQTEENKNQFCEGQKKVREKSYKINVVKESNIKWLIVVMVICTLTGFLTPLGTTPYTYLTKTMQGSTTKSINEHLPVTLIENTEFLCLLAVYIGLLTFTDTKIRAKYGFLLLGMLYLALSSRRQVSLFILICSYTLCQLIATFLNKYDENLSEKAEEYITSLLGKITVIAVMLILSILVFKPKLGNQFVNDASYPVAAVQYIKNNLELEGMKLYNEYNYGSYLVLNDIPVFIDSRADLYAPEFNGGKDIFSDFMNISNQGTDYEEKFKEYGITHVIMYKKAKLNTLISKNSSYEELYEDNYFVIYKKNV